MTFTGTHRPSLRHRFRRREIPERPPRLFLGIADHGGYGHRPLDAIPHRRARRSGNSRARRRQMIGSPEYFGARNVDCFFRVSVSRPRKYITPVIPNGVKDPHFLFIFARRFVPRFMLDPLVVLKAASPPKHGGLAGARPSGFEGRVFVHDSPESETSKSRPLKAKGRAPEKSSGAVTVATCFRFLGGRSFELRHKGLRAAPPTRGALSASLRFLASVRLRSSK